MGERASARSPADRFGIRIVTQLVTTPVVTCFLRNDGEVLLLRRSGQVGSYRGKWGAVAGYAEGDPERAAWREIAEETGLEGAVTLVRRGEPFLVEDEEIAKRWLVHPYLFDCASRELRIDWESTESAWVTPTEILRRDVVPQLWTSYEHVAPSLTEIEQDREHGSSHLSVRGLEVLRDRAAVLRHAEVARDQAWTELEVLGERLVRARPSMAALSNRVLRVLAQCRAQTAAAVEASAHEAIGRAVRDDETAAAEAARLVAGRCVLTLSRSGTVTKALLSAEPAPSVVVAESRPGGEGVGVAEALTARGLNVTLVADAAIASTMLDQQVDLVLVGADTVLPSGGLVNKVGSLPAALAARHCGAPFYGVAARDKVSMAESVTLESGDSRQLYAGDANLAVRRELFEITTPELVTGIAMECGLVEPASVRSIAGELRDLIQTGVTRDSGGEG